MANPYWHLPMWLPRWLKLFIFTFEKFDESAFEKNCKIVAEKRCYLIPDGWLIIAADATYYSNIVGVSTQWLVFNWAHEMSTDY